MTCVWSIDTDHFEFVDLKLTARLRFFLVLANHYSSVGLKLTIMWIDLFAGSVQKDGLDEQQRCDAAKYSGISHRDFRSSEDVGNCAENRKPRDFGFQALF